MGSYSLIIAAVTALYLAGTLAYLWGLLKERDRIKRLSGLLCLGGFGLHTVLLAAALLGAPLASMSSGSTVLMLSWCLLCVYFVVWWRLKLEFLSLTASPLALFLFLLSLKLTAPTTMPKAWSGLFLGLHLGTLFTSIGLMAMAFGAGLLFIHLENKIKAKEKLTGFRKDMPALATIDKVNHWTVVAGFPLYTLGIASGFIWAGFTFDEVISWDPKEVVAIATWFLYALLLHQRVALGWRGRKPALMAVALFAVTAFSFFGVNFFMQTHHSFMPKP